MTLSDADRRTIATELERAAAAIGEGNDGKARVCARRASGVALRAWLAWKKQPAGPLDAQSLLKLAADDYGFPGEAKQAALRLSAAVTEGAGLHSTDPIGDANIIIDAVARLTGRPDA
jgi:hypothetical protein